MGLYCWCARGRYPYDHRIWPPCTSSNERFDHDGRSLEARGAALAVGRDTLSELHVKDGVPGP